MKNKPDKWVVVKIGEGEDMIYKVFASWYGGYLDGDSWKMNSGITKIEETEKSFLFHGSSGSIYECNKNSYGVNSYTGGVLNNIIEAGNKNGFLIEVISEDSKFLNLI
jgi:hypothetical protein